MQEGMCVCGSTSVLPCVPTAPSTMGWAPYAFSTQLGPNLRTTESLLGDFAASSSLWVKAPWEMTATAFPVNFPKEIPSLCSFVYNSSPSHCSKVPRAPGEEMVQIWAMKAWGKWMQMCKYLLCKKNGDSARNHRHRPAIQTSKEHTVKHGQQRHGDETTVYIRASKHSQSPLTYTCNTSPGSGVNLWPAWWSPRMSSCISVCL